MMNRRKFFGLFGATVSIPFIPFKWNVHELSGIAVKKETNQPVPELTPTEIYIDGIDFSKVCHGLEFKREVIDITSMHEVATHGYRQYEATKNGEIIVELYNTNLCFFTRGKAYRLEIKMKNKTVWFSKNAILRSYVCDVTKPEPATTTLIFDIYFDKAGNVT